MSEFTFSIIALCGSLLLLIRVFFISIEVNKIVKERDAKLQEKRKTMKKTTFDFTVIIRGSGYSKEEAWSKAVEEFAEEPGDWDDVEEVKEEAE